MRDNNAQIHERCDKIFLKPNGILYQICKFVFKKTASQLNVFKTSIDNLSANNILE